MLMPQPSLPSGTNAQVRDAWTPKHFFSLHISIAKKPEITKSGSETLVREATKGTNLFLNKSQTTPPKYQHHFAATK